MGEWIVLIEGTDTGRRLALGLALVAAVMHATLGALQKGRHDPWLTRGAVDIWASIFAVPVVWFLVPAPSTDVWVMMPAVMLVHLAYKWVLAMAYSRGAFTAVYPIVRGTGPLATVLFAGIIFGEFFSPGQWVGVALLSGGIFALAMFNLREATLARSLLKVAIMLAVLTGLITAAYTVLDAYVIRLASDPFTFIAWFFLLEVILFPPLLWRRWKRADDLPGLFRRGFVGAIIAWISFGSIFLATRLDKVGEAAALRETSVIFAALIGSIFLGEVIGRARWVLMFVIAAGAVLIEFG